MKIKHFAGYGNVNAKKINARRIVDAYGIHLDELKIEVWGNHERGLKPYCIEDAYNWLVLKHFGKKYDDYACEKIDTREWDVKLPNGVDEEHCEYTFVITANGLA